MYNFLAQRVVDMHLTKKLPQQYTIFIKNTLTQNITGQLRQYTSTSEVSISAILEHW
jgi:hypothetical protein